MNVKHRISTIAAVMTVLTVACGERVPQERGPEQRADNVLHVITVNYPLAYFAERILGDRGNVSFPAPPDVDPAYWSPEPADITAYQQADLILANGPGYAAWLANATLPRSRVVDTTAVVGEQLIPIESTVTHTHGPTGDHSHGGAAFTTWLDFDLATAQAAAVADAIVAARPAHEAEFRAAFNALAADIERLDADLMAVAKALGDQPVLFSHPVYQYLERRYNLHAISVHWEPDEVPEEAQWRELQSVLQRHPAKIMIWEAEPLGETRRRLAGLGVQSVVFSPGGNRPETGDWLDFMKAGIASLRLH
jgi:zinc transport system substrate-binding protein